MTTDPWLTVAELAERFHLSAKFVHSQLQAGTWPCRRPGRLIRFSPGDVEAIEALLAQPARASRRSA